MLPEFLGDANSQIGSNLSEFEEFVIINQNLSESVRSWSYLKGAGLLIFPYNLAKSAALPHPAPPPRREGGNGVTKTVSVGPRATRPQIHVLKGSVDVLLTSRSVSRGSLVAVASAMLLTAVTPSTPSNTSAYRVHVW